MGYEANILRALLGDECYKHLALVANKCQNDSSQIQGLNDAWADFTAKGALMRQSPPTQPLDIVEELLGQGGALILTLQRELLEGKGRCLQETAAGKVVRQRLEYDINRIQCERKRIYRILKEDKPRKFRGDIRRFFGGGEEIAQPLQIDDEEKTRLVNTIDRLKDELSRLKQELKIWKDAKDKIQDLKIWHQRLQE